MSDTWMRAPQVEGVYMDRRRFLNSFGVLAVGGMGARCLQSVAAVAGPFPEKRDSPQLAKAYGSGHFGEWIEDQFGLPAYRYTCDQTRDPRAVSPVYKVWRDPTEHTHQVGNDRVCSRLQLRLCASQAG
jgi:hypothetical protein